MRSARINQPPGGKSSISLSWHDGRHEEPRRTSQREQRHQSPRSGHVTPRPVSARARDSGHVTPRPQSHRRDDTRHAHTHSSGDRSQNQMRSEQASRSRGQENVRSESLRMRASQLVGRASSGYEDVSAATLTARKAEAKHLGLQTQRRMESAASTSRSVPQFGSSSDKRRTTEGTTSRQQPAGARVRLSDTEFEVASKPGRYTGRDQPSRPIPGEEFRTPVYNSWVEPSSSRGDPREASGFSWQRLSHEQESRPRGARAEPSANRHGQTAPAVRRSQESRSSKNAAYSEKDGRRNAGLGRHPWSVGDSVATSARGSVIGSYESSDLWETSSADSLPLGAEWFNFMHR